MNLSSPKAFTLASLYMSEWVDPGKKCSKIRPTESDGQSQERKKKKKFSVLYEDKRGYEICYSRLFNESKTFSHVPGFLNYYRPPVPRK